MAPYDIPEKDSKMC